MSAQSRLATILPLCAGALMLSACGEVMGQKLADDETALAEFRDSCMAEAPQVPGSPEFAEQFCDCSIDYMTEEEFTVGDMIDQEKMTTLGEECAASVLDGEG